MWLLSNLKTQAMGLRATQLLLRSVAWVKFGSSNDRVRPTFRQVSPGLSHLHAPPTLKLIIPVCRPRVSHVSHNKHPSVHCQG